MNKPNVFPISVFAKEELQQGITRGRARVFYKGRNRNRSFISDSVGEQLIKTMKYSPVKGVFDLVKQDYGSHTKDRSEGRAYGFVPDKNNFAWEKHEDEDGVIRDYACTDVILWTGIYEEANLIPGSNQSMELDSDSIKGEWRADEDGNQYYHYTEASFSAMQILGQDVAPCFEGSEFFAKTDPSLIAILFGIENAISEFNLQLSGGGKNLMPKEKYVIPETVQFRLSDRQKNRKLDLALNEASGSYRNFIEETYDDEVIYRDIESQNFYSRNYEKKDDTDEVNFTSAAVEVFPVYVTSEEKEGLGNLRSAVGSFANIDKTFEQSKKALEAAQLAAKDPVDQKAQYENKIFELEQKISTLTTDNGRLQTSVDTLTGENSELKEFKAAAEEAEKAKVLAEKEEVIASYEGKLPEEIITEFSEKIGDYATKDDLDKDMFYKTKTIDTTPDSKKNPSPSVNFNRNRVPKDDDDGINGLGAILSQYKNR